MKLLLLVAAACNQWPRGTVIVPELNSSGRSDIVSWTESVMDAAELWYPAFDDNCPFPFAIEYSNDQIAAKPLSLISSKTWSLYDINGWESGMEIQVLGDSPSNHRGVIAHEIGHALGLEHAQESDSIMYYAVPNNAVPNHKDLRMARSANDCI